MIDPHHQSERHQISVARTVPDQAPLAYKKIIVAAASNDLAFHRQLRDRGCFVLAKVARIGVLICFLSGPGCVQHPGRFFVAAH